METADRDLIVGAVRASTLEVFATMLGLEVQPTDAYIESASPGPGNGVVALIGLAGPWVGTGSLSCSASFACQIAAAMLMIQPAAVDGEVLDAVAELTNMIIGNVKTILEERLGPMGLSIPTVIFGKNFTTRSSSEGNWIVVPFLHGEELLSVKVCLTPNRHPGPVRHGYSAQYSVHS